jgi:hypothetical protein
MEGLVELNTGESRKNPMNFEYLAEPVAFSTVFSTVVEILGKKPKLPCDVRDRSEALATVAQDAKRGFFDRRKGWRLVLKFRVSLNRPVFQHIGQHEGKAYVSTEYPPPKESARIPGSHVYEKRPDCAEASPRQGKEAFDGRRRRVVIYARGARLGATRAYSPSPGIRTRVLRRNSTSRALHDRHRRSEFV